MPTSSSAQPILTFSSTLLSSIDRLLRGIESRFVPTGPSRRSRWRRIAGDRRVGTRAAGRGSAAARARASARNCARRGSPVRHGHAARPRRPSPLSRHAAWQRRDLALQAGPCPSMPDRCRGSCRAAAVAGSRVGQGVHSVDPVACSRARARRASVDAALADATHGDCAADAAGRARRVTIPAMPPRRSNQASDAKRVAPPVGMHHFRAMTSNGP